MNQYHIVKTVHHAELEEHTRQGWRLIQVLPESIVETGSETVIVPAYEQNQGSITPPTDRAVIRTHALRIHMFLIGLDEKSSMRRFYDDTEALRRQLHIATEAVKVTTKAFNDSETIRIEITKQLENRVTEFGTITKARDDCRAAMVTQEAQLRKLRIAIGERTYADILA